MEVKVRNLLFYSTSAIFFQNIFCHSFTKAWNKYGEHIEIIPPVFEGFAPNMVKDKYKELKLATQNGNKTSFFCMFLKNVNISGKTLTIYLKAYFLILYTLTSVCIFSILFSIYFLCCRQGEFV